MKIRKKMMSLILSLSLAVAPISSISAFEENKTATSSFEQMQDMVDTVAQNIVSQADKVAKACEVTETPEVTITPVVTETPEVTTTPVVTETPASTTPKITYYNLDGTTVKTLTPYYYTKLSQLEKPKYNTYEVKVPLNYDENVVIPIKVNSKGALIYALAAEYTDNEISYYSLYSDAACTKHITTSDNVAYVPKAGTYYINISKYYLSKVQDSFIAAAFGFVSGSNVQLKNKSNLVSAIVNSSTPLYYKVVTTKATKLTFTVTADWSANVTLCNSKKKAITNDTYLYYSSDTESGAKAVYVVGKGTYYFKVKSSQGVIGTKAVFTSVSNASGTSKAKAGVLKVNGKTRSILVYPSDTTKKNYYFKFYNPKKQKVYVNLTSSFSSGKMQFEFYDSKGDSFGIKYIYDGINEKASYQTYVYTYGSSSAKTLPKGTYYIKLNKLDKKTSGIVQVNVSTKSK